jgi:hypothetical protein
MNIERAGPHRRLYDEQLRRKNDRIAVLELDLEMVRKIAEREIGVDGYTGHNEDAKIIITALRSARADAIAWKLKAEEAVRVAKVNESFADQCIDRLSAIVDYVTRNFAPLAKTRADIVNLANGKPTEEEGGAGDETEG